MAAKKMTLDELKTLANKAAGRNCTTTVDKLPRRRVRTSGIVALDLALGGGYPIGGIVEIWGREATYKSTIAKIAMSICQKGGGQVANLDVEKRDEHQFDLNHRVGLDPANVLTTRASYAEEYASAAVALISAGVDMISVDSIGAMTRMSWEDRDQTRGLMVGGISQPVNEFMRQILVAFCPEDIDNHETFPKTTVLLVNQSSAVIGGPPTRVPQETSRGGSEKNFVCLHRIQLRRGERLQEKGDEGLETVGRQIKFLSTKNSIAPEDDGTFNLLFYEGEDKRSFLPDNFSTVWEYVTKAGKRVTATGPKWNWLWRDAAAVTGGGGQEVDLLGKGPSAQDFIRENFRYVLREVFRRECFIRPYFTPWEVTDVPPVLLVKGKEVAVVGTDT